MSPEQLGDGSADVDTRSDVYALGALLYELLAGSPPYDLEGRGIAEAARIVREEEPRGLGQLNAAWRGDIETIVRTAMSKERERRYVSAAALAADLRRFLADEPIVARTTTVADRLRRTVRRHRVATALSVGRDHCPRVPAGDHRSGPWSRGHRP
jgi:serine/threonine protein kinase